MTDSPVRLRTDLVVSEQHTSGRVCFVIKDPATRRIFGLKEIEHFITSRLDGVRELADIRRDVEERFGAPLTPEMLQAFVERLAALNLLERADTPPAQREAAAGRIGGTLLYLRLKAFDPDRLLAGMVQRVRFLFTPHFFAASAATILLALGITLSNGSEIGQDLRRLYRLESLVLVWLTVVLVVAAHEFAHGLTCKRFGGEVREMGFLLVYFYPAFYCNVSDAWLFPEKSRRLWVTFAGAYVELLLWALSTVIWRLTEPDTGVNYIALIVMATSGVKTIFNFNPLIKLDGYYLLSDYLELPNLRQRAFSYLGARMRRLTGAVIQAVPNVRPRERVVYMTYGLMAAAYSGLVLGIVVLQIGSYLTRRYQGWGLMLFAVLLGVAVEKPLKRVMSFPAISKPKDRPAPSWAPPRRWRLLSVVAIVVIGSILVRMELRVTGEFAVLPMRNAEVRAEVEGIISDVVKDEGDTVSAGDLIARLADREAATDLRQIEAAIVEKQAKLRMLQIGARPEEIALARSDVRAAEIRHERAAQAYEQARLVRSGELAKARSATEKAEQRLTFARNDLRRLWTLIDRGLVARSMGEAAQEEATVRQKELEEVQATARIVLADELSVAGKERDEASETLERARGRLRLLLAGSRPEEIQVTEAEIARLEEQRRYREQQVQLTTIRAPAAGVITSRRLKERIGQRVNAGDLVATVHEQRTVTAEIMISEKEIAEVAVGQPVVLRARAYPGTSFSSRVVAIAPAATIDPGIGGRYVKVTADIDNSSRLLRSEMTGNAKVYTGKRRIVELLSRRLSRYLRVEFWSWW